VVGVLAVRRDECFSSIGKGKGFCQEGMLCHCITSRQERTIFALPFADAACFCPVSSSGFLLPLAITLSLFPTRPAVFLLVRIGSACAAVHTPPHCCRNVDNKQQNFICLLHRGSPLEVSYLAAFKGHLFPILSLHTQSLFMVFFVASGQVLACRSFDAPDC